MTEKFHWTIHSSWEPPLNSQSDMASSLKTPVGTLATPPPDPSALAKANTALFMTVTGLNTPQTAESFRSFINEYLKNEFRNAITEVKCTDRSDLFIIYCDNWNNAKAISQYKEKLNDHDVTFSLFSQDDPSFLVE